MIIDDITNLIQETEQLEEINLPVGLRKILPQSLGGFSPLAKQSLNKTRNSLPKRIVSDIGRNERRMSEFDANLALANNTAIAR